MLLEIKGFKAKLRIKALTFFISLKSSLNLLLKILVENGSFIMLAIFSMAQWHQLLYKVYITELMVHVNNLAFNDKMQLNIDIKKSNLIDQIIEYINNRIEEDITIDEISEYFYLSKFHLSREFKKYTGTTIHRYIVQKKLIEAKELILKEMPITDVYKKCGFGDYSNFFRAFKNEYGITPKQYYEAMTNTKI